MIPVGEAHRDAVAASSRERLDAEGFRVEVDERDETLGKRIRDAELEKIPVASSTATGSRTSRSRCASAAASSRR